MKIKLICATVNPYTGEQFPSRKEIESLRKEIGNRETDLSDIYEFMVKKYKSLKNKIEKVMNFDYKTTFGK